MKIKPIFKIKFSKKIKYAILLILILLLIAAITYGIELFRKSELARKIEYVNDVKDDIKLNDGESIINVIKEDINRTSDSSYVVLVATEEYSTKKLSKLSGNLEQYKNVSVIYLNKQDNIIKRYDAHKSFNPNMSFEIIKNDTNENEKYVVVKDQDAGNILILKYNGEEFVDVIKSSFNIDDLLGYTVNATFSEENKNVLKVKLDNYNRSYLTANTEEISLDFSEQNVNKDTYRTSYLANKINKFEFFTENGIIKLKCIQNILYKTNNDENLANNVGFVNTIFTLKDSKLAYEKVEVVK